MQRVKGQIVDVIEGDIYPGEIYISGGGIRMVERGEGGRNFVLPALVDSHVHIESSFLIPSRFARISLPHGTVGVVADPHEIANVMGVLGILWMIEDAGTVPQKIFFTAPSTVPASPYETSGATLTVEEVEELLRLEGVVALGEVMDVPGVIERKPEVMEKIEVARALGKPVDGHAPGLAGKNLERYFSAGITSDHECTTLEEAEERAEMGVLVLVREGSSASNMDLVKVRGRKALCTDDISAPDLLRGHMDALLRRAVEEGLDPLEAVEIASTVPIEHYRLPLGTLQVGDPADMVVVEDLREFKVREVFVDGRLVAREGVPIFDLPPYLPINNFNARPPQLSRLRVNVDAPARVRVIVVKDGTLHTEVQMVEVLEDGELPDPSRDILLAAILERYGGGEVGVGFVRGTGIKRGGVALSVSHDSHNVLGVAVDEESLMKVLNEVVEMKGGIAVYDGEGLKRVPLEVGGIMSGEDPVGVAKSVEEVENVMGKMGCLLERPLSTLSFLSLTVIPKLRLTPRGLFDSENLRPISLTEPLK